MFEESPKTQIEQIVTQQKSELHTDYVMIVLISYHLFFYITAIF